MKEIRLHGKGGQGLLRAAHIIVKTAVAVGEYGSFVPYFGVERRGAPVYGFLRLDNKPILPKNQVYNPDCIIILDDTLLKEGNIYEGLNDDSIVIINTKSSISDLNFPPQVKKVGIVDATKISLKHLGRDIPNTTMLGAFCKTTDWLSIDDMSDTIGMEFDEINIAASREGFEFTTIYTKGWKISDKSTKRENIPVKREEKMNREWTAVVADEGTLILNTGDWRVDTPEINHEECIVCGICAQYCPVGAIRKENPTDEKIFIDLKYCKGCGICEAECPKRAISMYREKGDKNE